MWDWNVDFEGCSEMIEGSGFHLEVVKLNKMENFIELVARKEAGRG